jgi:ketosteroid isomerase-like protein
MLYSLCRSAVTACGSLTVPAVMRRQTSPGMTTSVDGMNPPTDQEAIAAADRAREQSGLRILSMTPDGQPCESVASVLRGRIETLGQAIRDKDLVRLMSLYARNVEVFDVRASLNVVGAGAYRNNFEHWFDSFEGPIGFDLHCLRIVPGDTTAFCHYLALVTGARPGGRKSGYWVRGTTCFERRGGEWLVTHEHISQPAAM